MRFSKEAQKCYCESVNCRGYIGATETASIYTDGSRITSRERLKSIENEEKARQDEEFLEDLAVSRIRIFRSRKIKNCKAICLVIPISSAP